MPLLYCIVLYCIVLLYIFDEYTDRGSVYSCWRSILLLKTLTLRHIDKKTPRVLWIRNIHISHQHSTDPYPGPVKSSPHTLNSFLKINILSSYLCLGLKSGLFSSAFLFYPMQALCPSILYSFIWPHTNTGWEGQSIKLLFIHFPTVCSSFLLPGSKYLSQHPVPEIPCLLKHEGSCSLNSR